MSARCKRCGFPLVDGRLSETIADITALLDLDVPRPEWLGRGIANIDNSADLHLRIGAASSTATHALALSHGFCSTRCARESASEKTTTTQENAT